MIKKHFLFCVFNITSCLVMPNFPSKKDCREHGIRHYNQLKKFLKIIDSLNVNRPLNEIKGLEIKLPQDPKIYPLEYAISIANHLESLPKKYEEIIDHLLTKRANPNKAFSLCPLVSAIYLNDYKIVSMLIAAGAKVDKDIFLKIFSNRPTYFYDSGIPKKVTSWKENDLNIQPDIINLLIRNGADVNAQNSDSANKTAIMFCWNHDMIRHLLDNGANCFEKLIPIKDSDTPKVKSIKHIFDALQDSENTDQSINLNNDAQSLKKAYILFQQGTHEPLREMLIIVPWLFCRLTENKDSKKDPKWAQQGKFIRCNTFALDSMVIACQHVFKPASIRPLIRYLALARKDGNTMCEYKRMIALYDESLNVALEKTKTKQSSCCSIS